MAEIAWPNLSITLSLVNIISGTSQSKCKIVLEIARTHGHG